jgi:hypothetical protein
VSRPLQPSAPSRKLARLVIVQSHPPSDSRRKSAPISVPQRVVSSHIIADRHQFADRRRPNAACTALVAALRRWFCARHVATRCGIMGDSRATLTGAGWRRLLDHLAPHRPQPLRPGRLRR